MNTYNTRQTSPAAFMKNTMQPTSEKIQFDKFGNEPEMRIGMV